MSSTSVSSKTAIVTGATGEIGKSIANLLAKKGLNLVLPVRDLKRGQILADSIKKSSGNNNIFIEPMDLSSYKSIINFTENYTNKYKTLDILVNNAALSPDERTETSDGIETQFGVNVWAYYLLMKHLRPVLKKSDKNNSNFTRIVNVASNYAGSLDLNDLQFNRRRYDTNTAYTQSKQANRMLTIAAAQKFKADNIAVFACHPGIVTSKLLGSLGMSSGSQTPDQGAATPVYLATDENKANLESSGTYWHNSKQTQDQFAKLTKEIDGLWEYCEQLEESVAAKQ